MSLHILLKSWSGSNCEDATRHLAQVFRLSPNRATTIIEEINSGTPWQFEQLISDAQANLAKSYLEQLGFSVAIFPIGSPPPKTEHIIPSMNPAPLSQPAAPELDLNKENFIESETLIQDNSDLYVEPMAKQEESSDLRSIRELIALGPPPPMLPPVKKPFLDQVIKQKEAFYGEPPQRQPPGKKSLLGSLLKPDEIPNPPKLGTPKRKFWFSRAEKKVDEKSPELDKPYKMGFSGPRETPKKVPEKARTSPVSILILILIFMAAVTAAALPYWFGGQIEQKFDELQTKVPKWMELTWTNIKFKRDWFHSNGQNFAQFPGSSTTINMNHQIDHGPLLYGELAKGNPTYNILQLFDGNYRPFVAQAQIKSTINSQPPIVKSFPPLLVTTNVDLKGYFRNQYRIIPYYQNLNPELLIKWEGLSGKSDAPPDLSKIQGHIDLLPLILTLGKTNMFFSKMRSDFHLKRYDLGLWLGPINMNLEQVSIREEKNTLSGNGFLMLIDSAISNNLLSLSFQGRFENITSGKNVYGPGIIHAQISNLNAHLISQMRRLTIALNQNPDIPINQKIMAFLNTLAKGSPSIEISKIEFKTPNGSLKGNAKVKIVGGSINLVDNPLSILGGLEAKAEVSAPKPFFDNEYALKDPNGGKEMKIQLPVKFWKKQGYLKSKGKNYSLLLEFKKGTLTLNGKPFNPRTLAP